jgi:hypothetical protein
MRTAIASGGGAVVVVVGIVLFAAGHATLGGMVVQGRMPGDVSFSADERNYAIALRGPDVPDATIDAVRCTARRSDGSTKQLSGGSQESPVTTDGGRTAGSFDAPTGLTRVRCGYLGDVARRPTRMFVAPLTNTLRTVAVVLIAIGVAALGVGLWPYARARFSAGPGIS